MPSYKDFAALARKRFEEKRAKAEKKNQTGPFQFTRHAEYKMQQYGLSGQRVRNVIRNPKRTEKGIVPRTIAVMQPVSIRKENGKETWKQEIWVMFLEGKKGSLLEPATRKIISAWRYPGVSPKRDPIPEDILRELLDLSEEGSILEGEE